MIEGDVYDAGARDAVVLAAVAAATRRPALALGDGAHDASVAADDQDDAIARLARCELAVAVLALAAGGNCVLKLFLPLRATAGLAHAAARLFDEVVLAKPAGSRATSGEVYLVATGFRAPSGETRDALASLLAADSSGEADAADASSSSSPGLSKTLAFLDAARRPFVEAQTDACGVVPGGNQTARCLHEAVP